MFENPEEKFEEPIDDIILNNIDWNNDDCYLTIAQKVVGVFDHIEPVTVSMSKELEDRIRSHPNFDFMNPFINYLETNGIDVRIE